MTPELIAGKRATAEMIKGVGGVEASAEFCRVGKSVLSDNQNVNRADSFVAIDVVACLEPLARQREGWPHVTRWLCRRNGGAFVELPQPGAARGSDVHAAAARHAKESSEITAGLFSALSETRLTPDCVRQRGLVREAREAVEAAVQLLAMLEAIEAGGE